MKVYSADREYHPTETDSVSVPVGYFKANQYLNKYYIVIENVVNKYSKKLEILLVQKIVKRLKKIDLV